MLFLQRAAVRRMLALETRGYGTTKEQEAPGPHPFIRKLVSRNGLFIYANLVRRSTRKGEGQTAVLASEADDSQGLGKTVTALALILRTRGSTPRPPPGTKPNQLVGWERRCQIVGEGWKWLLHPRQHGLPKWGKRMLLEKLGIAIQQGYPAPCLVYPYAGCLAAKRAQDESGLLHFGPCPSDIRCRLGGQQQQQQPVAGQSRHTQQDPLVQCCPNLAMKGAFILPVNVLMDFHTALTACSSVLQFMSTQSP
eukprot:883493-Pelagomonas_calceolata.AAC.2